MAPLVDTTFDVRTDTPAGADPDAASPTLRRYHRLLWDKELPSGARFALSAEETGSYLHHRSQLGEFWMTSDAVVHTYRTWSRFGLPGVVSQIPEAELDEFETLSYTIGGMMLFPSWTGVRHWSINQTRGMLSRIADRMDLTLECIRLHYAGDSSPMTQTLAWYDDFFALFESFAGYAQYFLLDDLLVDGGTGVRFLLPFDGFTRPVAAPADVQEYRAYMRASMDFVSARNSRINTWQPS